MIRLDDFRISHHILSPEMTKVSFPSSVKNMEPYIYQMKHGLDQDGMKTVKIIQYGQFEKESDKYSSLYITVVSIRIHYVRLYLRRSNKLYCSIQRKDEIFVYSFRSFTSSYNSFFYKSIFGFFRFVVIMGYESNRSFFTTRNLSDIISSSKTDYRHKRNY